MTEEKTADIGELVQSARNQLALIHSLANDITEANWADKRLYVLQTCVRQSDALSALEARCAELEKERDALKRGRDAWATDASELAGELASLRDRIEREPVVDERKLHDLWSTWKVRVSFASFKERILLALASAPALPEGCCGYTDADGRCCSPPSASAPERVEAEPAWAAGAKASFRENCASLYASPPAPVVTDEMVEAALKALHDHPVSWEHPDTIRAILEAALASREA